MLLSDQVIEFEEGQKDPQLINSLAKTMGSMKMNKKTCKPLVKEEVKKPPTKQFKTNPRNTLAMAKGKQLKKEKEVKKLASLQKKLQQMSTKYRQFFKDIEMKE